MRIIWLLCLSILLANTVLAQEFGTRLGQVKRGGKVSYEPSGPGVLFDALDPVVRKWYVPQELYTEFGWQAQEYNNYSRALYQRYVDTSLEGDFFYDVYGNFLLRGWLIYDWRQENPQPFGSSLEKSGRFSSWFSNLVIASDHKGQYHYAVTISSRIRTTLTPMTFSKPQFDGLQWDFASDKYEGTLLLSRISDNGASGVPQQRTDNTNLIGGRMLAQVGDFARVGGTFINAHQAHTQIEAFSGDMFSGNLSAAQNAQNLGRIEVLISDDSPEDRDGGGALFANDVLIHSIDGNIIRGSEIGFRAIIEGGFQRRGFLSADGNEQIRLIYDFGDRTYTGPDISEIKRVEVELVIANDYLIAMASDRQGVFLEVAQASGNVQDNSNQRVIRFDYGLPTANQIAGFTLEWDDFSGLEGYLEVNINKQFRQYPNPNLKQHDTAHERATAWLFNVSKSTYPLFAFAEGFRISPRYATHITVVDREGRVDFRNDFQRFEFVEDNDDQDRFADWRRKGSGGDREVFPGWDENNDFISDFNQNDNEDSPNLIPDYEEPFLRYYTDRPEFLFGLDMNHNGTIDRFENDEEPDYPYKRDRRGYNIHAGAFLGPTARLTLGQQRIDQISDKRHNKAMYLVFSASFEGRWGRLRLFQDLRRVKDTIIDDLFQWVQPPNTRGGLRLREDVLPAVNTWINTSWLGWEYKGLPGFEISSKFKWQIYRQRDRAVELELNDRRRRAGFIGLINKTEYRLTIGDFTVVPRWKSEFLSRQDVVNSKAKERTWTQLFMILARFPIFRSSFIESGIEYEYFRQLYRPTPPGALDDFAGIVATAQLTNFSDYQGYRLTTILGFELARKDFEFDEVETRTRGFVSIFAGVQ